MEVLVILLVCVCLLLALLVVPAGYLIMIYNTLVKLRLVREQSFSDIDVQLKQRYDLIPNLVETVKGYAKHESGTLENVTKARTMAMSAGSIDEKIAADNMLSSSLKTLFAVSESYPDLKANTNFLQLQGELSDIENKIAAARRFFNSATSELNTAIQVFPNNLVAGMFGFKKEIFFDLGDEAEETRKNVKVQF
jgi:LemA protein